MAEGDVDFGVGVIDAEEAESAGADGGFSEPWEFDDLVAEGVIVLCAAFADFSRGFGDGFAEADADGWHVLAFGHGGEEFDGAGDLDAEVDDDGGARFHDEGWSGFLEDGLSAVGFEEVFGVGDSVAGGPDDACGWNDEGGERAFLGVFRQDGRECVQAGGEEQGAGEDGLVDRPVHGVWKGRSIHPGRAISIDWRVPVIS